MPFIVIFFTYSAHLPLPGTCGIQYLECYRIKHKIPSGTMYETCRSIHAEMNAVIQAGRDKCLGSTMYIYGHSYACDMCKRALINAGVHDVFIKKNDDAKIIKENVGSWTILLSRGE